MGGVRVELARAAAWDWVAGNARSAPWYRGAYHTGSIVDLADADELPATSDVDVAVVVAGAVRPSKIGKIVHNGVLLEVSLVAEAAIASVERVLGTYYLAGSFRRDSVIDDPTGHLGHLHREVAARFAEAGWVRRRCADAEARIRTRVASFDPRAPWPEQVTTWLFGAGVTAHVLLVAALRNPTVRLRYRAAREVLTAYRCPSVYGELLDLLGCRNLAAERVRTHLDHLALTFDAAADVARTPFPFSSDITPRARTVAIDGSAELVEAGEHREAVFWIAATYARCHMILAADGTRETRRALRPAFDALLADLGIGSTADLSDGCHRVAGYLPRLTGHAEQIQAANAEIRR